MSGASAKVLKLRDVPGLGLFVRVTNIVGSFTNGEIITGQTTSETATMNTITKEFAEDAQAKNVEIESTANGIIDFTEGNPFSEGTF